ncbi:Two-component system response regulator [hydrothermal vent metagenome]|uniref:Two-component system response regulator n=1 Tax=hydrothermal vent metagenome TaxID=652676 RepID=A0A1W1EBB1_9ZZZZ
MQNNSIEIIIIEDEEDILELVEYHLTSEGYCVTGFLSTHNVEQFLEEETPALMIVDRNLPGVEGSDFVRYLRDLGYSIPVIFLTAKDSDSDLEEGFEVGADDYITKPFRPTELKLRVKALLKRYGVLTKQKCIKYKKLTIDMEEKILLSNSKKVSLTPLEFKLLKTFLNNIDKPLRRDFLRDEAWGVDGAEVNDNAVNVAINRLKNKIDPKNEENYFKPVWGIGYKFS